MFENSIPTTEFFRDSVSTKSRNFDHEGGNSSGSGDLPFGVLDDLNGILNKADQLHEGSCLLTRMRCKKGSEYHHSNETAILRLVKHLFEDIVSALDYDDNLHVQPEVTLTQIKYSEYLLISTFAGRPVMVVDTRSPRTVTLLDEPAVQGQLFDYMCEAMSFFGQHHILGVTTTMKSFRLHWFPHSDVLAAATSLPPVLARPQALPLDMCSITSDRVFHHSRVIPHDDPQLLPMLASVVIKGLHFPHAPVGAIDSHRTYLCITATGWVWSSIHTDAITTLTLELTERAASSTGFLAVKYFCRSEHRKVWLVVSPPHNQLVVLKVVDDVAAAEQEGDVWRRVNDCDSAFVTKLCGTPVVGMPFAIHASTDKETQRVSFNLDISHWALQRGAEAQALSPQLAAFQQQVMAGRWTGCP